MKPADLPDFRRLLLRIARHADELARNLPATVARGSDHELWKRAEREVLSACAGRFVRPSHDRERPGPRADGNPDRRPGRAGSSAT
ncbi:MAG TPA: hypothetical protein VHE61_15440 [Opitutaceae bacterium]|nr:hypothetical protein [Opitutaceae bacterium]